MLFFGLCLANITGVSQKVDVHGKVAGGSIQTLYLYHFEKVDWQVVDSVFVQRNEFFLSKDLPYRGWFKLGPNLAYSFDIILGPDEQLELQVDASHDTLQASAAGSTENMHLQEYLRFQRGMQNQNLAVQKSLQNLHGKSQAEQLKLRQQVLKRLQDLESERQNFYRGMSAKKEATLTRKLAAFLLVDHENGINGYFKQEDFDDPELANSFFYQGKLNTYLLNSGITDINLVLQEIHKLVDLTTPASKAREALLISAIKLLQRGPQESVALLARRYQMEFPNSDLARQLVELLPAPGPQIGDWAPDIRLENVEGKSMSLSSLKGNYVLLDFWASWCRPCRIEAPHVVEAFHQFKDLGFTVFSVSLDSNRERWLKAIETDGMVWHHVSDLKGWKSAGAAKYGIRSIPATYLIDPQGKIIAKDLRGPELAEALKNNLQNDQP